MTKSNWRNELYLGERVGGAGTLVRQGIKVGGKKGGKAVQKGTTAATAAGKTQVQKAKQGNQKKMVGSGKYEKLGAQIGGLAGGAAGVLIPDGPAMVAGELAGGYAGSKIGGKIGRQFDKKTEKKKLTQSEETELTEYISPDLGFKLGKQIPKVVKTVKAINTAKKVAPYVAGAGIGALIAKDQISKKKKPVGITTAVKKEETLLYDVVHDYIITENFASDTESANKVILKLSDELMQEIYERTMTASEKRKDTMLKKKYDDSDMKKNMQGQYGKEEGKKVYFATIRKQAMKKEEVEVEEEVGITTHSMMMKDKAKKEAMLRMKERDAVAKKLRKEEVKRDEYGDPVGGPKISKKQLKKNLTANAPDEDHTNTTAEGYGSERVGPALTVARAIDKVNPRPKPNSKRTMASRALKMASIKKDEKIRKRKENPYSTDKKLKMVATSIRDRVKQKAKSIMKSEDYIPEEGYDIARDQGKVRSSKDKKDATTMPPSKEMKKTQKVNKGPSALELVRKKYGKSVMGTKK